MKNTEDIPDKALVLCWENSYPFVRHLRFYDAIHKCSFSGTGKRGYTDYDNYEVIPLEKEPEWAKEARKYLQDLKGQTIYDTCSKNKDV